jgi:small-conductance mechanosensitive channel/CRP-like cAMP-binding protein
VEHQIERVLNALPPYGEALRFAAVLFLSFALQRIFLRGLRSARSKGGRLAAAAGFPVFVLLLSAAASVVPSPWGFDLSGAEGRRVFAWNLFWVAALAVLVVVTLIDLVHASRDRAFLPPLIRRTLLAVVYLAVGFTILKYVLDVDITPLLATSAVLTMVIGLALQGVLGNLLAGFSLNLVKTVEVGNLVAVGDQEGIVVDTNWRETIIRTRSDDYVLIPNSVLAAERIVNYSKPEQLHRHTIEVGASYSDAPGDVIAALEEAAREASAPLDDPAPKAHLAAFLDFGINYKLFFYTRDYWPKQAVEGEVGRHIWYKFKRRGIEIPFPMSDQLLNDFMAVVYNQRRLPPAGADAGRIEGFLSASRFLTRPDPAGGDPRPLLDEDSIRRLAASCRLVRYTQGEILCRQGDRGEACYVVARGSIEGVSRHEENGSVHSNAFQVGPGGIFGEMSLLAGTPRTATGSFSEETELVEIPKEAFARMLADHEEILEEVAAVVARRNQENREFLERIAALPARDVEESCDSRRVLARLKSVAAWGRRLIAG